MEDLVAEGSWWIPSQERRASGTLSITTGDSHLNLHEALREYQWDSVTETHRAGSLHELWTDEPIMHGFTRTGEPCSLVKVSGSNISGPFDQISEYYTVGLALLGQLVVADSFVEARVEFDLLAAWLCPPELYLLRENDAGQQKTILNDEPIELAKVDRAGLVIRALVGTEGSIASDHIDLKQVCTISFTVTTTKSWKELLQYHIEPFRDLLILLLGRPVRLTRLWLREKPESPLCPAHFSMQQPNISSTGSLSLQDYRMPTLLMGNDPSFPLSRILQDWPNLYHRYSEAFALYRAPFHSPYITAQHAFSSIIQAAEALHKASPNFDHRDLSSSAHRARVDAVRNAGIQANLDEAIIGWATRILQSGNYKPLRAKLAELLSSSGTVGEAITKAAPEFIRSVVDARNGVSHPLGDYKIMGAPQSWLRQTLQWVIRAKLIRDLGVPNIESTVCGKSGFQQCLRNIID